MVLPLDSRAFRLSAKSIQKKSNVWCFRRRVKAGCEGLHRDAKGKPHSVLFFSLKTKDQLEAAKKANEHVRRQDARWANHLDGGSDGAGDPKAALGRLETADLKRGDGLRDRSVPALEDIVQALTGGGLRAGRISPSTRPPKQADP